MSSSKEGIRNSDIAVIGMSGRFPGADNIEELWDNILNGEENILRYSKDELLAKGIDISVLDNPNYVLADAKMESAEYFDSSFFGITPREADFMDPQHRIFLEECYSALNIAGYDPNRYDGDIGVYAGCSRNNYFLKNLLHYPEVINSNSELQIVVNNDKDFLATRASYKLNLTGPSLDIQSACSTSLVSIHVACQSLIQNDCDIALSGGVFIRTPRGEGYFYEKGSIDSPTGTCRPFDKNADGTIFGDGIGIVVLKRLTDAINDRDTIHAVIKGTAINNDGVDKVGYMAPSIRGQAKVIEKAINKAGVEKKSIGYIEAHGTGTKLGDPIEISALKHVFNGEHSSDKLCALGSIKANIGHLDVAAGVTGLIKSILVLKHKKLPPCVNLKELNPELELDESPFYINTTVTEWVSNSNFPRRAGVSSFGIGGTNSHAVLEEYIQPTSAPSDSRFHLMPISAKTNSSLEEMLDSFRNYLARTDVNLADVAFTLQNGRQAFNQRGIFVLDSGLEMADQISFLQGNSILVNPRTVFMFTGQGSQYAGMLRDLYKNFESARIIVDYADELLEKNYRINLSRHLLEDNEANRSSINETNVTQPALFVTQYVISILLKEFGITPDVLIGHSIGEITAAAISEMLSFEDALLMVAERGKLMHMQHQGTMLSINISKEKLLPLLSEDVDFALHNGPEYCVVSGTEEAIHTFDHYLNESIPDVRTTILKTSHAYHSRLMEPALTPFIEFLSGVNFGDLKIPVISNITGTWLQQSEAQLPEYWAAHIRTTVNFHDGVQKLLEDQNSIYYEVGPGNTLTLLLSQFKSPNSVISIQSLKHAKQKADDINFLFQGISKYWVNGGKIDWESIYPGEDRYRVPLPPYSFDRRKHWIDAKKSNNPATVEDLFLEIEGIPNKRSKDIQDQTDTLHPRPSLECEYTPPESKTETTISKTWSKYLGIKDIGKHDDFFILGGHSLLALQILNQINADLNLNVGIEKFFENPTVSGFANSLSDSEANDNRNIIESYDFQEIKEIPLLPVQERLWIISQIDHSPSYNIPFTYRFRGQLDIHIFSASLVELFDRHKILKSYIKTIHGQPSIFIDNDSEVTISEKDLTSSQNQDVEIQEFIKDETLRQFDIESGPLFRIYLVKVKEEEHIFHFVVHHLIFDGWSWGIFISELKEIYNSLKQGDRPDLAPLKLDYIQYAIRATEAEDVNKYEVSANFWKSRLEGIAGKLELPLDYPRKETSSGEGGRIPISFGKERTERIDAYCKTSNVTKYMFLLTSFGVLLSRYSGQRDICIGSPVANRPGSDLEKIIGLFINSIVQRLKIEPGDDFAHLLKDVRKSSLASLSYQDFPFEDLVEMLQPERVMNMNPIFQVMFAWQNTPRAKLDFINVHSERVLQENGVSPLDITLYAWEEAGDIVGELEYSTDIFSRSTITRLRENLLYLVDRILDAPDSELDNLPVLSLHEQSLVETFNDTFCEFPSVPVHGLFERSESRFGDRTALEFGAKKLSYSELEDLSNRFASYLSLEGFGPGQIAGVSMSRGPGMLVAVLGILKSGGAYLPLDPSFPDERLIYMLEDSGAGILITESGIESRFSELAVERIVYDTFISQSEMYPASRIDLEVSKDAMAYLIYTSGSTGKPKGVKVHHGAVVNFLNSMSKRPGFGMDDRLLAVTTLSFDISVLELFLPLSCGATVCIASEEAVADADAIERLIEEHAITMMQATPATWSLMIGNGWKGYSGIKALCGGEALLSGLARDLIPRVDSLWNMYGPTETTVWSSCEQITDHERILVGTPIDNTHFYILRDGQQQPIGSMGEVCIGGAGVTLGYHNREKLTTERFINWNGEIIYCTGDIGRYLEGGKIEIFGRNDNQIKHRGYRIEPGEIEFQLSQLSGIREAVVKLETLSENDERLVGYLNVTMQYKHNPEEIAGKIGEKLPRYMIPQLYVVKDEFPRTLNGKIDRKALILKIEELVNENPTEVVLSSEELEIAHLWEEVLKIKNIPSTKDFFDVGGNSLLALSLINRLSENRGINLSFKDLLDNSTIRSLTRHISNLTRREDKRLSLKHLTRMEDLPLTSDQKRIWIISKLLPDNPAYNIALSYRLAGSFNEEIFEKSLNLVFRKHYNVFSLFVEKNGSPVTDIKIHDVVIERFDFTKDQEVTIEDRIKDLVIRNTITPIDITQGPLFRLFLVKISDAQFLFHMTIHHIVFDGISWQIFLEDLSKAYNSILSGGDFAFENLAYLQFDYAQWEESHYKDLNHSEEINFWTQKLAGTNTKLNLTTDFPRPRLHSGIGGREVITLSEQVSNELRVFVEESGTNLYSVMLSIFGILMQKWTDQDDFCIGTPVANRPHSDLEKVFGMFVNTLILRIKKDQDISFSDFVKRTYNEIIEAMSHRTLPFEEIVDIISPDRDLSYNPLFQVTYAWRNNINQPLELDNTVINRVVYDRGISPFDITFYMWENKEKIEGEIEYNSDLFRHETILAMKDSFIELARILAFESDSKLNKQSLVSSNQLERLESFNYTKTDYPSTSSIVDLFEQQVVKYPKKTAICYKDKLYSYKELNTKVNRLAHTLINNRIRKEDPVGILMDKSNDLIIAILSVLKAGGVYVPIDPEYPRERIDFILEDTGCQLLLVNDGSLELETKSIKRLNVSSKRSYSKICRNPNIELASDNLAYIMYTSGTTGKPKGSMIEHKGVIRLVRNTNYIQLKETDRILLTGAIVFDATTFEIWGALLNGGTLYVTERETLLKATTLKAELEKYEINILWLTSALFTHIAEADPEVFSKLEYLLSGGDVLSVRHVNKVKRANPGLKIINGYGPTENTTFSTCYLIEKEYDHAIPIGNSISNSRAYIFDSNMNYLPIGSVGELYLAGDGLSRGYLNREDLNREKFVFHPTIKDERLYRTGDLARWLPDGNIEFHGRGDNQLKIRGYRVELEEIEIALNQLDGIAESVIIPRKIDEGDIRLIAFIKEKKRGIVDIKRINGILINELPSYLLPSYYKIIETIPRTVNGKTDRKLLDIDDKELIDLGSWSSEQNSVMNEAEKKIYKIWSDILKKSGFKTEDNFFNIGGNSLLAISVVDRIEKEFNIEMNLRVFFDDPTVASLAAYIEIGRIFKNTKTTKTTSKYSDCIVSGEL